MKFYEETKALYADYADAILASNAWKREATRRMKKVKTFVAAVKELDEEMKNTIVKEILSKLGEEYEQEHEEAATPDNGTETESPENSSPADAPDNLESAD